MPVQLTCRAKLRAGGPKDKTRVLEQPVLNDLSILSRGVFEVSDAVCILGIWDHNHKDYTGSCIAPADPGFCPIALELQPIHKYRGPPSRRG